MLVTDKTLGEIARLGTLRKPEEACGLLFAGGVVVELENESELDKEHNYALGPLPSVLRQLREAGVTDQMFEGQYVVWHTHASGMIGPSPIDMQYRVKGVQYLVVALTEAGPVPAKY